MKKKMWIRSEDIDSDICFMYTYPQSFSVGMRTCLLEDEQFSNQSVFCVVSLKGSRVVGGRGDGGGVGRGGRASACKQNT